MAYATSAQIRLLTGWGTQVISDIDMTSFITLADRLTAKAFATKVYRERITTGNIDGSNTEFKVLHAPIADIDFDSDVDKNEVEVYYATNTTEGNLDYGSVQTVTSVEAHNGIVNMTTAPTTVTAEAGVYITYSYTSSSIDYNLIVLAANYFAAHLASMRVKGISPNFSTLADAPYLRKDIAGGAVMLVGKKNVVGVTDLWIMKAINTINEALGHKRDGVGFRAVEANP